MQKMDDDIQRQLKIISIVFEKNGAKVLMKASAIARSSFFGGFYLYLFDYEVMHEFMGRAWLISNITEETVYQMTHFKRLFFIRNFDTFTN